MMITLKSRDRWRFFGKNYSSKCKSEAKVSSQRRLPLCLRRQCIKEQSNKCLPSTCHLKFHAKWSMFFFGLNLRQMKYMHR
ncbi:hypothetical protein K1719_038655 [Acacia pycnantha]|nr:hypothetical protein K1719_038655 [Acacia pycnantha]